MFGGCGERGPERGERTSNADLLGILLRASWLLGSKDVLKVGVTAKPLRPVSFGAFFHPACCSEDAPSGHVSRCDTWALRHRFVVSAHAVVSGRDLFPTITGPLFSFPRRGPSRKIWLWCVGSRNRAGWMGSSRNQEVSRCVKGSGCGGRSWIWWTDGISDVCRPGGGAWDGIRIRMKMVKWESWLLWISNTVMIKTIVASPIFHIRSKFSEPRVDNPRFVKIKFKTTPGNGRNNCLDIAQTWIHTLMTSLSKIIPPESLEILKQRIGGTKYRFKDVSDASGEMQNQWLKTFKDGIDK